MTGSPKDPIKRLPVVLEICMPDASTNFVLRADVCVKEWMKEIPSTEDVRPSRCPNCEVAAAPPGQNLNLHGHGTRERLVLGPISFQAFLAASPERVTVQIRRYQCQVCETTMTVLPRQVRPHCLYLDLAVVGALALWVHQPFGFRVDSIRAWISPQVTDSSGWRQMRRWARGAHRLCEVAQPTPRGPPDEVAADLVGQIAALGPERREWPVWKRAVWQLSAGHHAG